MKEDARAAGAGTGTGGDTGASGDGSIGTGVGSSSISTMATAVTTCHRKDHVGGSTMEDGTIDGGDINDPASEGGDLPWPGYGKRTFDASDMQLEFLPYEGTNRPCNIDSSIDSEI